MKIDSAILVILFSFFTIANNTPAYADLTSALDALNISKNLIMADDVFGDLATMVELRKQVEDAAANNATDELALAALGEIFSIAQNVGHTISQKLIEEIAINNQGLKQIIGVIDDFDVQGVSKLSLHYQFAEETIASINNDIVRMNNFRALGSLVEKIGKYGGGAITASSYISDLDNYRKEVEAGRADFVSHITIIKDGFKDVTETAFPPSSTAYTLLDDVLIEMVILPSSDWVGDAISDRRTAAATEVANILSESNENLRRRIRDLAIAGGGTSQRDVEAIVREVNGELYRNLFAIKDIVDSSWTSQEARATYDRVTRRALEEMLNPSQQRISAALSLLGKFSSLISTVNTLPTLLKAGITASENALSSIPPSTELIPRIEDNPKPVLPNEDTGIENPVVGGDGVSDRSNEDKIVIGDDKNHIVIPPVETSAEIAARLQREADERARLERERLAAIVDLRAARNGYSISQQDATARLQERRNRLTVLQFNELEKVQNASTVVRNRISELRTEQGA